MRLMQQSALGVVSATGAAEEAEDDCAEAAIARKLVTDALMASMLSTDKASALPLSTTAGQQWTGPELMINWSATHSARASRVYLPETEDDVCAILRNHSVAGAPIRPIGSCISPNGLGMPRDGGSSINLAMMDRVLHVDKAALEVRVQAGAKVSSVVDALKAHDLTLENFASISDQQLGGFTQVSAHGTGARIAPVDEQVVALRLALPCGVVLELRGDAESGAERRLFRLARTGLGGLGVVTELTLRVVPRHLLREVSWTISRAEARDATAHAARLRRHRHVRYMWIPYTDTVVVVASDVVGRSAEGGSRVVPSNGLGDGKDGGSDDATAAGKPSQTPAPGVWPVPGSEAAKAAAKHEDWALQPLKDLIDSHGDGADGSSAGLSFAQLRDRLMAKAPLDVELIKAINTAEAAFWTRLTRTAVAGDEVSPAAKPDGPVNALVRVDWSDRVLGFDCGGSQWVNEVALPAGTVSHPDGAGVMAVEKILRDVAEGRGLPSPAPIEQRWTAASSSPLSPASIERWGAPEAGSESGETPDDAIFSWIGIIQYMPKDDDLAQRAAVTAAFKKNYEGECRKTVWPEFRAAQHWAKIETDTLSPTERRRAGEMLARDFDLATYEQVRGVLDPQGILANDRLLATVAAAHHRYAGGRA
jgi:L-galactono-1,4-lactone dehydrogenase